MTLSTIQYRPASAEDQTAIKALVRVAGINPMGIKWQRFTVATDEHNTIIGCGQIKPHGDGSRELASIAVEEAWRGQGIARAIIESLMAQEQPPLWLTCASPRIPIYQKFGFREIKDKSQMPAYFSRMLHLFPLFKRVARKKGDFYLAVMVWDA